jgi:hypothetical protein
MAVGWWCEARASASAPSVAASSHGSAGACFCQLMHDLAMEVNTQPALAATLLLSAADSALTVKAGA